MNGRRIQLLSVSLLAVPLIVACSSPVTGSPTWDGGRARVEAPAPVEPSARGTSPTSAPPAGPLTIGTPKKVGNPPDCGKLLTPAEVGQATKGTATQESDSTGTFCAFKLASGPNSSPGGVILVLSHSTELENAEKVVFEGNSAYRRKTAITCDLRIALHNNTETQEPRAMWLSVFSTAGGADVCAAADQLAKAAFGKLAAG